ncbi:hypothetical protein [Pedobacter jejuensis]|uniref:Carboxypeptidase regulatory-like domain-containing protein n=1 Tax=Pedobacter jejuensis TaxID=1268550 RepID=A0A3N0C1H0_9SPHI|nr:hypothetical protein [Pedobacter jejuensis]RNL56093.1 hypothetical protein D7004_02390 [Pedobacter jejuensis]
MKAQIVKLDSLAKNLYNYSNSNKSSTLFIHFDKNIYTNNDKVWFTGYLLKTATDLSKYNSLYLSLVNNQDSSVVVHEKFLIENGYVFGSLTLPDSIQSGNYRFIANTNVKFNGLPDVEFVQPITIKSTTINPLLASISPFKTNDNGSGIVLIKAISSDNRFVANADVTYTIGKAGKIIKSGKAKTSIIGELMIDYSTDKINSDNNQISVVVKKNNHISYAKLDLPVSRNQYVVNFYPESGNLVLDVENKIGFEIKDLHGKVINTKAVLYANEKVLDTLSTSYSGMGSFLLKPKSDLRYSVKLLNNSKILGDFELPKPIKRGATIRLNSALSNSELRTLIYSNFSGVGHIVVHNYEEIFLSSDLKLNAKEALKVRLKLDSVPIGLNTITLLDSAYKPIAERIFFAHFDKINRLQIKSNKTVYNTRDSVKLDLKILNNDNKLAKGMVSVAVVQSNRMALSNKTNIVDYAFLESEMELLPKNLSGIKYTNIDYLENILLIKGWRKYKWPEHEIANQNQSKQFSEYEYTGFITKNKKALTKPVLINTIGANNVNSFNTDSNGRFLLPYNTLLTDGKSKIWLNIGEKNSALYEVKLVDPSEAIQLYQSKLNYTENKTTMSSLTPDYENITSLSGIKLNEVTIKKKVDDISFASNVYGRNACGDYVCDYGILNCQNHSFGKLPVKGKTYPSNGRSIVYQGCLEQPVNPNFLVLRGISLPKEFYVSDITNMNEPINFPTVYWNYQLFMDGKSDTVLKFTTGDLTGPFKIIIQGVSENGVVFGEETIEVKKP